MARRELPSFLRGDGRFLVRRRDFRPANLHTHEQGPLRDKVDEALAHLVFGVASLPLGSPVELEVIFEVKPKSNRRRGILLKKS